MIFLQLFLTFFQIGLFGFGGGYAMISLIQGQVVSLHHWMTMGEFTDVVAISQMTPGPVGINMATYCGYTAVHNAGFSTGMSILGSATATFALVLPSVVMMILISKMFMKYMRTHFVQSLFLGLRPAVVGLLAAATLLLLSAENFSDLVLHLRGTLRGHVHRYQGDAHQPHPHDSLRRRGGTATALLRLYPQEK